MGVIINIDEAMKLRSTYNIFREPLNKMIVEMQEAWEKENPLDMVYTRGSINQFQTSFTSNIGFDKAFVETGDFMVGPIFNTAEGFSVTYRTRIFQGSFVITQQTMEDMEYNNISDTAAAYVRRWNAEIVEYGVQALQSAFGESVVFGDAESGKSYLQMTSADTIDGDIHNVNKNPLFTNHHTIVKRDDRPADYVEKNYQSNCFYAELDITGPSPDRISALSDVINQVVTRMENYRDDNNKRAGVIGAKTIVACNDPHLRAAIDMALTAPEFHQGDVLFKNPGYQRCTAQYSPYFNDIACCYTKGEDDEYDGEPVGFFIIDKAYNSANHGPEITERTPMTLEVHDIDRPRGIIYDGRQRFDINCASWRGIAYVSIKKPAGEEGSGVWNDPNHFTKITPVDTIVKPVTIVGTVETKSVEE